MREILVKSEDSTNPEHGKSPEKRTISEHIERGMVNLDKPSGPTSHQVSSWVKGVLSVGRAGHSGTLDPKVTGVLPVGIEKSTKVLGALLLAGKEYVILMHLHDDVLEERARAVVESFRGIIYQKPPLKSAVKRRVRKREIYGLEIIEAEGRDILFRVNCEAGTYIRKLCHDIGLILGCGAHMQELRRTRSGSFDESSIVTLHGLKDAYELYKEGDESKLRQCIQPIEAAVSHIGKIWLKDGAVDAICHGATLKAPGISKLDACIKPGDVVALMSLKGELVATGQCLKSSQEIMGMKSGEVVKTDAVFMEAGTYPKGWKSKAVAEEF
ncbi:MAG: tRNA pseudouridine(55) synthase TruB [Candidatus Altiarchaeales archaeon IMC4]|nr:MAG: tRNA pseudouridine(55) synthase TruB [Candidatus Altiarchaeales archaeon IMC4]